MKIVSIIFLNITAISVAACFVVTPGPSWLGGPPDCLAPENQHLYSGPQRQATDVARLRRGLRVGSFTVAVHWVISLNGEPVKGPFEPLGANRGCPQRQLISILPGHHELVVKYHWEKRSMWHPLFGSTDYSKTYRSLVRFEAKSNRGYVPHSRCEGIATPMEKCEVWLADEKTGEIIGRGRLLDVTSTK